MKNIYIVHPFRQHNFEQAAELKKHFGDNVKLITSFYIPNFLFSLGFLKKKLSRLENRTIPNFSFKNVKSFPFLFLKYKIGLIDTDEYRILFIKRAINKIKDNSVIIGYDCSSFDLFKSFEGKSTLVLDLTIALENYSLVVNPKWYNDKINITKNSVNNDYFRRKIGELGLANYILAGSKYVFDSVVHFHPEFQNKLKILPYGYNPEIWHNKKLRNFYDDKLNLIFVGTVSYRKGFQVILNMIKQNPDFFEHFNLKIFGNIDHEFEDQLKNEFFQIVVSGFVSFHSLNEEMNRAHVLILPSFHEGSSITVYQAMATGLPCVVTHHAGSIITDKVDGIICEVGDENSLFKELSWVKNNRSKMDCLSQHAEETIKNFTWFEYGSKLANFLKGLN